MHAKVACICMHARLWRGEQVVTVVFGELELRLDLVAHHVATRVGRHVGGHRRGGLVWVGPAISGVAMLGMKAESAWACSGTAHRYTRIYTQVKDAARRQQGHTMAAGRQRSGGAGRRGSHIQVHPTLRAIALGRETGVPERVSVAALASLTAYIVSAERVVSWPNLQRGGRQFEGRGPWGWGRRVGTMWHVRACICGVAWCGQTGEGKCGHAEASEGTRRHAKAREGSVRVAARVYHP